MALADLIRSGPAANQEELADRLAALGFAVTQATISRDLEQIGAAKVRRAGHSTYVLPDIDSTTPERGLASILRDFVRSIEPAANLLVVKTPPGSAHLVGVALDQTGLGEIVGTICGDDTLFIACRSAADAEIVASKLGRSIAARP